MSVKMNEQARDLLTRAADPSLGVAEALQLSEQGEKILLQLGVKDALAEAKRKAQKKGYDKMVEKSIKIQNSFVRAEVSVAMDAALALGAAYPFASSGESTMTQYVHFVGPEADVDRAIMLAESLIAQAAASRRLFWATKEGKTDMPRKEQRLAKRAHVSEFGRLAMDRIMGERADVEAEAAAENADVFDILTGRRTRVSEYVAENYSLRDGRLVKPRTRKAETETAEAESEPDAVVDEPVAETDADVIEAVETGEPEPVEDVEDVEPATA